MIFLRQLSHPNIVKFYGTNLQHGRNGTTVMIILELCSCSLSYHVMSHPEEVPARLPKEAVMEKVLGWALNILDALRYIHCGRFAHRDLKLDNILVSSYTGYQRFFLARGGWKYFASLRRPKAAGTSGQAAKKTSGTERFH